MIHEHTHINKNLRIRWVHNLRECTDGIYTITVAQENGYKGRGVLSDARGGSTVTTKHNGITRAVSCCYCCCCRRLIRVSWTRCARVNRCGKTHRMGGGERPPGPYTCSARSCSQVRCTVRRFYLSHEILCNFKERQHFSYLLFPGT